MGITRQEALDCFHSDDLIGLGMEADAIRRHLHPEGVVSYSIDGHIDYAKAANGSGHEPLFKEIEAIVAKGGSFATLQGKITPITSLAWFETLFRAIKQRFPTSGSTPSPQPRSSPSPINPVPPYPGPSPNSRKPD